MEGYFWGLDQQYSISEDYEDYIDFIDVKPLREIDPLPPSFVRIFLFTTYDCYTIIEIFPDKKDGKNTQVIQVDNLWYGVLHVSDEIANELGYREEHYKTKNGSFSGGVEFHIANYYFDRRKSARLDEIKKRIHPFEYNIDQDLLDYILEFCKEYDPREETEEKEFVRLGGTTIFIEYLIEKNYNVASNARGNKIVPGIDRFLCRLEDLFSSLDAKYEKPYFLDYSRKSVTHHPNRKQARFLKLLLKMSHDKIKDAKCPECESPINLDLHVVELADQTKRIYLNYMCSACPNHKGATTEKLKEYPLVKSIYQFLNYQLPNESSIHIENGNILCAREENVIFLENILNMAVDEVERRTCPYCESSIKFELYAFNLNNGEIRIMPLEFSCEKDPNHRASLHRDVKNSKLVETIRHKLEQEDRIKVEISGGQIKQV